MEYDYRALIGRVYEIFGTQAAFAKAIGLSERSVSLRLNNKVEWGQNDMVRSAKELAFENGANDIPRYFFNLKVQH